MSHDQLVLAASRWLRCVAKCPVVFTELVTSADEVPDAIGFKFGGRVSILIECKTSRSDYARDRRKLCRRLGSTLGAQRYYMARAGLLLAAEIPEPWGLLEVTGRAVAVTKVPREGDARGPRGYVGELSVLLSALRRDRERIKGLLAIN